MFEWLFLLFTPVLPDAQPKPDYVGPIAAEAAYTSMAPEKEVVKPKVPTKDCKTCNGTGKVKTGDGQGWTKCPDCDPDLGQPAAPKAPAPPTDVKIPKSDPARYKTSDCPNGQCPLYRS
jgi:hypothetical protein